MIGRGQNSSRRREEFGWRWGGGEEDDGKLSVEVSGKGEVKDFGGRMGEFGRLEREVEVRFAG